MLVRFVASNFLSFKEEVEFNMLTGDFETHKHHIYEVGKVKVLKAAAIYGANGAGKSNLVKAIGFLQNLVQEGAITTSVNSKKFKLDPAYQKEPVRFEIEFFTNKKLYSYGVVIDSKIVLEEWLYEPRATEEDRLIFERTVDGSDQMKLTFAEEYRETEKQKLLIELLEESLLKENQLLLGKDDELKIDSIKAARSWIVWGVGVRQSADIEKEFIWLSASSKENRSFTNEVLKALDIGAGDIRVEEIELNNYPDINGQLKQKAVQMIDGREGHLAHTSTENGPVYVTYKNGQYVVQRLILDHGGTTLPVPFYLSEESDGTRKLLSYTSSIHMLTTSPLTYIFDEIERSIHPSLLKALLQKIMNDETTKGQLIFTTHESNLLDLNIFRQDEIWFAKKERETGATQFYSLSEFKPDYGNDIEKGYLNGRFGAVPFLGDLENLNWHQHAEKE